MPDLSAFATWLQQQELQMPPFHDYQPIAQGTIMTLLNFVNYNAVLDYFSRYLFFWMGKHPPQEEQVLGIKMRSIIQAYEMSPGDHSAADFQNYLNTYFSDSNNDLCIAIPGLAPWVIYQMFADLGLQNPHVYTIQDYAYAGVCQALAKLNPPKLEPDYDVLTSLTYSIRDSVFDPSKWQSVLDAVTLIVDSSKYGQLQPATQNILQAILSHFPPTP